MLHHPADLKRYNHYRKKDDIVVIKFGAEWCGPCKKLTPHLEELAKSYPNIYFLDIDMENPEFENHEDTKDIRSIPHVKIFQHKKLIGEVTGYNVKKLNHLIESLIKT